ncbi:MAG: aspartyl protease family protein [Patescibacteria group bacterium]
MITKLSPEVYLNPVTGQEAIYYSPKVAIVIWCNHLSTGPIRCLIDTGATFNVFPAEVALAYLGFSKKSLVKKCRKINFGGIGGIIREAYGHLCTIHTPDFRFNNVYIYFMDNQPYPLLGRVGFMDHFDKIVIDETRKNLELFV